MMAGSATCFHLAKSRLTKSWHGFRSCLRQACLIRDRLRSDPKFRDTFREVLWPILDRISNEENRPLATFVAHPAIWDLLLLPEGERLAAAYGLIPASLLFGLEAYAESLRRRVIRLLLLRRKVVFEGLTDHVLRHNVFFR